MADQTIEIEAFFASICDLKLWDGRERMVEHGHGPERMVQAGIDSVPSAGSGSATAAPWVMKIRSALPRRSEPLLEHSP